MVDRVLDKIMKNKIKLLIYIGSIVVAIIGFIFLLVVWKEKKEEREFLTIYGNVDIRQVDLGFRVFGRVTKLFYDVFVS